MRSVTKSGCARSSTPGNAVPRPCRAAIPGRPGSGWNGESDPVLDGIGEQAYLTRSGMDRKVGFTRGGVSVLLSFDYGEIDVDKYAAIARLVDEGLTRAGG